MEAFAPKATRPATPSERYKAFSEMTRVVSREMNVNKGPRQALSAVVDALDNKSESASIVTTMVDVVLPVTPAVMSPVPGVHPMLVPLAGVGSVTDLIENASKYSTIHENGDTPSVPAPDQAWKTSFKANGMARARLIMDQIAEVKVTMYDIAKMRAVDRPEKLLNGLVNEMIIGEALTRHLMLRGDYVVSPHVAVAFDHYIGPLYTRQRTHDWSVPVQYIVTEHTEVTKSLASLLDPMNSPPALEILRSIMWQVLYTLDAAYAVSGFLHGYLTPSYIRLQYLDRVNTSPYREKKWLYVRSHDRLGGPSIAVVGDHANIMVKLISFARSRIFEPVDDQRRRRVLIGNDRLTNNGLYIDDERIDRSLDVRVLCTSLLFDLDLERYAKATASVLPLPTTQNLIADLRDLLAVGSNLPRIILVFRDKLDDWVRHATASSELYEFNAVSEALEKAYSVYLHENRDAILGGTYVPPAYIASSLHEAFGVFANYYRRAMQKKMGNSVFQRMYAFLQAGLTSPRDDIQLVAYTPERDIPTFYHKTLTAQTLLSRTLFDAYRVANLQDDTVLTGYVPNVDIDLPTEDAKRWTINACFVCGNQARGHALDANAVITREMFCGPLCVDVYFGHCK